MQAGFIGLVDIIDFDVGQALGAVNADEFGVAVDFTARHAGADGDAQGRDAAVFAVGDVGEHLEGHILDRIGDFRKFKRNAQVGLI